MVLDTRAIASLDDLADVLRGYVSPGRSRIELTPKQKEDGCMMRYLHGWHVHHIVEALGIANANYSHNWEDNMMEALEECALSDYWNTQRLRLSPGDQISAEGPNPYGGARMSALRNAMAQILVADPKARNARTKDKDKKDIPGTSLMERSFVIIDSQIEDGSYRNTRPAVPGRQNINRYIRDMEELGFVWEGAGRTQIMAGLSPEHKEAIDNEIRRQCRQQLSEGATITRGKRTRAVTLNYSAIARNVHSKFILDEQSQETMASLGIPAIQPSYVLTLCQDANITVTIRKPVKGQVEDEGNIKLVSDMQKANPTYSAWQIHQRTGLSFEVVEGIFDNLGLPRTGREHTEGDIRAIILKAHDDESLTIQGMIEKHSELAVHFKDNVLGVTEAVRAILLRLGKTPHTDITLAAETTEERRLPLVAGQVKGAFLYWLRSRDQQWRDRVSGNLGRVQNPAEPTGLSVAELAASKGETLEFMEKVVTLLVAETPQLIAIRVGAQGSQEIVIPASGLRWILQGGKGVDGDMGL